MKIQEVSCPLCNPRSSYGLPPFIPEVEFYEINEGGCGCASYKLTRETFEIFQGLSERQRANIKGHIHENPGCKIDKGQAEVLRKLPPPSIEKRMNNLMRWVFKETEGKLGEVYKFEVYDWKLMAVSYSLDKQEAVELMLYLREKGYLQFKSFRERIFCITLEGRLYLESLDKNPNSPIVFVAMWFDSSLDSLYYEAIKPAIEAAGYEALRIDEKDYSGGVVDKILSEIRRSKFVIADLTGNRGGAYYEAGFAQGELGGIHKIIFTCKKAQLESEEGGLHFDVRHYNFLVWEEGKWEKFKKDLTYRITALFGDGPNKPLAVGKSEGAMKAVSKRELETNESTLSSTDYL